VARTFVEITVRALAIASSITFSNARVVPSLVVLAVVVEHGLLNQSAATLMTFMTASNALLVSSAMVTLGSSRLTSCAFLRSATVKKSCSTRVTVLPSP
jgi:siroheme synthase